MTGCAIVAIPDEYSPVWKVSSEKVPHLTMLYLGELADDVDQEAMALFVQHVAATSLQPFGLSVDHRGTLGDDDADVLFFEKNKHHAVTMLENVRAHLLTDDQISTAYHSIKQYPEWTPHLTLGYPATPAKPDPDDQGLMSWIFFDKIAIWFGESEGPTFRLKHKEHETLGAMAMTDVSDFFEHFGVKGMRWGVKKAIGSMAKDIQLKDQDILDARANQPAAKAEYKQAKLDYKVDKAKYRQDKKEIGRAMARATLNRDGKSKLRSARSKYWDHLERAGQETSDERMQRFIKELFEPPASTRSNYSTYSRAANYQTASTPVGYQPRRAM